MFENKIKILKTDKEIFEALIKGEKIKKLSSTNVKYVYLKNGYLVDYCGVYKQARGIFILYGLKV